MSEETVTTNETVTTQQPQTWTSSLSPEYQNLPNFSKFKDVNDLAKSYVNLEKLVGLEKIPMPKDEKDQAGWDMVYNRLGRPESPDKYEVKLGLAEGLQVPDEVFGSLKKRAHSLGMSTKQLQGILDHWSELENNALNQRNEQMKQAEISTETELRKQLGANYETSKKNVEAFIRSFVKKESQEAFLNQIKTDRDLFETFYNASKGLGEDSLKGAVKQVGLNPEEANLEYRRILADTKGPYYNPAHPEHELVKKKVFDLLTFMEAGNQG